MERRANAKQLDVLENNRIKSTIKARRAEMAVTRMMREQFQKNEKIALRSSKVYKDVYKMKQIQVELAAQRIRKGGGEAYIDSDRRIAVAQGAEDLKGQVEKYKDELTTTGRLSDNDILLIHVMMEQCKHDLRNNKPVQAMTYVEKALKLDPSLVDVLELKCQCYLNMNRYKEALVAANRILIELREYDNSKALAVKADALYNMGDFEHALVNFYKAKRLSTVKEKVILSNKIKSTELAVMNSVGPQVAHYFQNLDKILIHIPNNIMGMPWQKVKNMVATKESKSGSRVKDRKFLSQLATDKHYLEKLSKTLASENISGNITNCDHIVNEANNALDFLNDRRDFWSQQNPEYPEEIKGMNVKDKSPLDVLMTRIMGRQKGAVAGLDSGKGVFGRVNQKTITAFLHN